MLATLTEWWQPEEAFLSEAGILPQWMTRFPAELSGGELQRFCIARALGPGTEFLIADEITTMLDAVSQAAIWEMLLRIVQERGIGLLVVTHNEALAKSICTRVVRFSDL